MKAAVNMPSANPFEQELTVGISAVRAASALCRAVQSRLLSSQAVLEKNDRSPVTVADFGSQALICASLHAAFKHDAVIAEEDASAFRDDKHAAIRQSVIDALRDRDLHVDVDGLCALVDRGRTRAFCERFWTLDPIDGTKGFLRAEQYAVALALIVDGRIEVGILGCPNLPLGAEDDAARGAIFFAVRGRGAFMQPLDSPASPVEIRVSACQDAAHARFCESVESGHSAHDDAAQLAQHLGITQPPRRLDSQAKYALLARGDAEIYLRLPTRKDYREKIWDHAAGAILVTEAGGRVTDIGGRPLDFTRGPELVENRGVIATNGPLHDAIVAALASRQGAA